MCNGECDKCELTECLYPLTQEEYAEIVASLDSDVDDD